MDRTTLRRFAAEWDALTIPDYIKGRILNNEASADRHPVLLLSASVIVFASLLYLLAIFKGAGHLFQIFLGVPYEVAVGVTLVVVVLYTSIGGFVSVVRTDAIQGVFMLLGAMTIFYFVTKAAGGIGASQNWWICRPNSTFLILTAQCPSPLCWAFRFPVRLS